jgi:outer membrane lipoprotein carrier protein
MATAKSWCPRATFERSLRGAVGALAAWVASAIFVAAPVHAAAVDQLRSFLTQTASARGDFVQRVTRSGAAAQESRGRFVFQRPGKFRWIYDKPYEQLIVADGQQLTMYDRDLNQVTVRKLQSALPSSPASILFGSNDFEREFDVSEAGARDGLEWISAKPRAKDTPFARIEIGFRSGLPGAMLLVDSFGQTTHLTFNNVQRNPQLDGEAFRFTPPKGADVLTE